MVAKKRRKDEPDRSRPCLRDGTASWLFEGIPRPCEAANVALCRSPTRKKFEQP